MKLYVGNLPYNFTEEDLKKIFENYTKISCKLIVDRETGRSKGFGFVEFEDKKEAEEAIEEINGKEIGGRAITVNEARPKTDRPRGGNRSFNNRERRY